MKDKVDIFLPMFVGDYLADTTDLTTEEHGAYLLLMFAAWKRDGVLPNDPGRLARIAGVAPGRWEGIWATIGHFWTEVPTGLKQGRLTRELERARAQRAAAVENGKRGAARRYGYPSSHPTGDPSSEKMAKAYSPPSPSDPDPDPPPRGRARSQEPDDGSGSATGTASTTASATKPPLTGLVLLAKFANIRSVHLGGLPWTIPPVAGGKASTMADSINEDPAALADVEATVNVFFKRAKAGKLRESGKIASNMSYAFGSWCSMFSELREEISGRAPAAPPGSRDDDDKPNANGVAPSVQRAYDLMCAETVAREEGKR